MKIISLARYTSPRILPSPAASRPLDTPDFATPPRAELPPNPKGLMLRPGGGTAGSGRGQAPGGSRGRHGAAGVAVQGGELSCWQAALGRTLFTMEPVLNKTVMLTPWGQRHRVRCLHYREGDVPPSSVGLTSLIQVKRTSPEANVHCGDI